MAHSWPGNVRELRNVIERALIVNPGGRLETLDLPPVQGLASTTPAAATGEGGLNLRAAIAAREKETLVEAVRRSGGVRKFDAGVGPAG